MTGPIEVVPIGWVRGGRADVEDDAWGEVTARIELDAVDGTPVLDVKPHMAGFAARGPVREPPWAGELMHRYW